MKTENGFTLIELLIVVAIVAILAAIAVPNFLDAQIRAKVSAVKSDQRSLALAIEAYATQWNRPPLGATVMIGLGESSRKVFYYDGNLFDKTETINYLKPLTSPTAFIAKIPNERFGIPKGLIRVRSGTNAGNYLSGTVSPNNNTPDSMAYHYDSTAPYLPYIHPAGNNYSSSSRDTLYDLYQRGYSWVLVGSGPDRIRDDPGIIYWGWEGSANYNVPGQAAIIYDPTNGTKSSGGIVRTNKGIVPVAGESLIPWYSKNNNIKVPLASWINTAADGKSPSTWN